MKNTKKFIAILMCLAILPWTLIPVFADGQAEDNVLYSMTFDNSGDEAEKVAEWDTTNQNAKYSNDGYLQLATSGWNPMRHTGGKIVAASTFTVQVTYRHNVAPTSTGHAVAVGVGSSGNNYEVAAWRAYTDSPQDANDPNGSSVPYWDPNSPDTITNRGHIPSTYVQAFKDLAWITVTVEIIDGAPSSLKFESEGLDAVEFSDYAGSYSGLTADQTWLRFTGSSVDVKDFRIIGEAPEAPAPVPPTIDADNVLYSMTFDNSGDEESKVAEWNFDAACSIKTFTDEGYLKVKSSGWGTGIELDNPFIASTFTAQLTYRWNSADGEIAGSDQIQWRFGGYDDYQWQVEGHEGLTTYAEGSSCLRRWGDKTTGGGNANAEVSPEIVTEWKNGEWVTATIEVVEGKPTTFTFASNGKSQTFNYQSGFSANDLGSGYMAFYFINQAVEIYDFRVVEGVNNTLTVKNDSKVEMVGLQKHSNGTDVRLVAKLKDIDVEDVKFEIKAVKTSATEMVAGKCYVTEAITKGYTSVISGNDILTADDGELYVVFVLYGLDLDAYDYDFTVSAIAGSVQCLAHTYTVE